MKFTRFIWFSLSLFHVLGGFISFEPLTSSSLFAAFIDSFGQATEARLLWVWLQNATGPVDLGDDSGDDTSLFIVSQSLWRSLSRRHMSAERVRLRRLEGLGKAFKVSRSAPTSWPVGPATGIEREAMQKLCHAKLCYAMRHATRFARRLLG